MSIPVSSRQPFRAGDSDVGPSQLVTDSLADWTTVTRDDSL